MRGRSILTLAAASLGLALGAPGPSAGSLVAAPIEEAWQTVCYNVYEPMWLPGIGWRLVLAKRCQNELSLAPVPAARDGAA
ncbi:MAG TPA: hypothetical protein VMU85_21635 [Stellaceae bacterium]|nr:hypothetical protein [Stellaceae bacterium]